MRLQRRSYGKTGGGIDWGRTILHIAIIMVVLSVIQMVLGMLGFGAYGLLILCLAVILWHFLPGIIRNMKIKHRDKTARKRDPVERSELIDLD
jgi:membrane protein required for beta-lactamase induction